MFNTLIELSDGCTRSILERAYSYFRNARIVSISELLNNKAVVLKSVLPSPEVTKFVMLQLVDHVYSYVLQQRLGEKVQYLLVVDEAYYILQSPLIELFVRGLRKFGLGTVMVTQTLTNVSVDVLQNLGFVIILGGPDPYVNEVAQVYKLTEEDVQWLSTALPPHMYGKKTRALLITGPIKRQVEIELEEKLK